MKNDKSARLMYKDIQNSMNLNMPAGHVPKHARFGKRENWVPVWPQLDQGYEDGNSTHNTSAQILNSSTRPTKPDHKTYGEMDVSSLRKTEGERAFYRAMKLQFYESQLDMHLYERTEQGMDMWHRDESKYNTKKFNADVELLDFDFSEDLIPDALERSQKTASASKQVRFEDSNPEEEENEQSEVNIKKKKSKKDKNNNEGLRKAQYGNIDGNIGDSEMEANPGDYASLLQNDDDESLQ